MRFTATRFRRIAPPELCKLLHTLGLRQFSPCCGASHAADSSPAAVGVTTLFFPRIVVITTTLTSTNAVPRIVRKPSGSPAKKYPSRTAITGFTYAYVPTFVGDSL